MQKYKTVALFSLFLVVVFIFLIYLLSPVVKDLVTVSQQVRTKSTELQDLERKVEALKANELEKQSNSAQTKDIFKPENAGTDVESSFTVMFDDIIEMAKYNGIKIYSIGYAYNPAEDEIVKGAGAKYNVCVVTMQIIADYADTDGFVKDLYKYPYLINIDKVESVPYSKDKKILITNMQLKLYSQK